MHHHLIDHLIATGRPPGVGVLASRLGVSTAEACEGLRRLEEQHGVVLHRGADASDPAIWLAHPFSTTPTLFWVSSAERGWWAPCIWCALGIAALVDDDVTISTRFGGETEAVDIEVRGGQLLSAGLVAHFCVAVARAWDDVHRFCSTALVFRTSGEVQRWCARHGYPLGSIQTLERVWALARAWYGGHRARDWRKHTQAEAKRIFESVGLSDPIWSLEPGAERF